jgi:PKD domain
VPQIPGLYAVGAIVTDSDHGTGSSAPLDLVVTAAPSAAVSVTPNVANVGQSVFFNATGSGGSGTLQFNGSFGDGATGTRPSVRHAFLSPGQYGVTRWMNDSVGGSTTQVVNVTVVGPAPASAGWTTSDSLGVLLGVGLVVVAVVAVLFRRRSSDRSAPEGPSPFPSEAPVGTSGVPDEVEPSLESRSP